MNKRKNDDRRNELRRMEARREADVYGPDDFLVNDFDTPASQPSARATRTDSTKLGYGLIAVAAVLLIVLGVLVDQLVRGA